MPIRWFLNVRELFTVQYILSKLKTIKINYSLCSEAVAATAERRESTKAISNAEAVLQAIRSDTTMQEPGMKTALSKFHDWMDKGYLSKDAAQMDYNELNFDNVTVPLTN